MTTEVELRVTADLDQAKKEVAGFSKEYASLVSQIEKPLRQVNLARDLEKGLESTGKQVALAKTRLSELQRELINTDYPTERLKESFKEAKKELEQLVRTEAIQANQLARVRGELKGAGIDTTRMAAEQRRLNQEMSQALGSGRNDAAVRGIRDRSAALQQQAIAQRQANLEAAKDNLGVNRYRALQAEIGRANQQYEMLRRNGGLTTRELAVAQQQLTAKIRESREALQGLNGSSGAGIGGGMIASLGGAVALASVARTYIQITDEAKKMDAQLRLATSSQEEFNRAQAETMRIAQENVAPVGDVVALYARLAPALRDVGRGQEDALRIIDAVTKSLRISGATAAETASTIQQFSQALGSGVLRGEEFNTLAESSPRLLRALADGLNVNVGALREMASQGKLTADVIANSLIGQLPKLTEEASQLPETFGGAATKFNNILVESVSRLDDFTGASESAISSVNRLSGALQAASKAKVPEGLSKFAEIYSLLSKPQVSTSAFSFLFFGFDNKQLKKSEEAVKSAASTYELQLQVLEMAEVDSQVRRLAAADKAAADRQGLQYDEEASLRRHTAELGVTYEEYIAREKERQSLQQAGEASHNEKMKSLREQAIADKQREIKAAEDQLKKANASLSKARENELAIEREFSKLISDVRGGGAAGDASLSDAYDARVNARRALQAGDSQRAIEEARRAGEILKQLQSAGVNDYGFEGIAEDLARIAGEAAKLERVNTEQEVAAVSARLETLKKEAEALAVVSVDVQWDGAGSDQVLQRMKALAAELAKVMIIRPTVLPPVAGEADADGYVYVPNLPPAPAFARGGILRGRGTGTSDSNLAWLSNGEGILNARAVQHYGADLVHRLNRLSLPRYATGGVHGGGLSLPPMPQLAPALQQQLDGPNFPDLGRLVLEMGGQSYTVYAPSDQASELKLAARKFGRTSPR